MSDYGKKFYKQTTKTLFRDACIDCGRLRVKGDSDWSYDSEKYCAKCGSSYSYSEQQVVPIYVLGVYKWFDGEEGYCLSETPPDRYAENRTNGKGVSYWSYLKSDLGTSYYATREEAAQ